jgi:hypothetical protein
LPNLPEKMRRINFFTGNIQSLLDSLSGVGEIEIKKYYSRGLLEEEITMILK